ncbi:hypothetical protein ACYCAX_19455 [Pseudomonas sp. MT3]
MDDKKRRSSGDGIGLSEKSLSTEEILERGLSLIAKAGSFRELELEAHKSLGRIDALSLAGLIDRVRAKAWGQRVLHATAMAMLELEGRV